MRRSCLCDVRARPFAVALLLAVSSAGVTGGAAAQTVGGTVKDHLDKNLDKPKPKKQKRRRQRQRGHQNDAHRPAAAPGAARALPPEAPEEKEQGPDLPIRVIGKNLKLDPSIGLGYRGWIPQSYPSLAVRSGNTLTFQVELKAQFFRLITLHRGYYESNALSAPRHEGAVIAADVGGKAPKALWVLGMLGVPIKWVLEPMVRYESRVFETIATPREGRLVRIIPQSASKNDDLSAYPETNDRLRIVSAYETFVVGLRYHHDNDPYGIIGSKSGSFPPIYFGVGLTRYDKPYQVTVGDAVLDSLVFNARFEGIGLALGLDTNQEPRRFYGNVATQFGLGRVKLTHDYTLNEDLPANWAIGYAVGNFTGGYLHPLLVSMPTPLLGADVSVGGATFFYFKTVREEGEPMETPSLNWDLFWQARAYFVLPL